MGPQIPSTPSVPQPQQSPPTLELPPLSPAPKDRKSLAIALIVAGVLLVAAMGIGMWLVFAGPNSAQVINSANTSQAAADDTTKQIKKVSFVAPASIPVQYTKRDQSTADTVAIYYFDDATACGIATNILPLGAQFGTTPKEAIVNAAKAAESQGIKTVKTTDGTKVAFKDAASDTNYNFSAIYLEQDVQIDGIDFKKQFNTIAFKQFGKQVASIAYSCKSETWEGKKAELQSLVGTFKIKAEK